MKKVLIATTNKDKYKIVAELFRKTIFSSDEYEISPITNDMNIPDEKETGSNIDRARTKAVNAHKVLKDEFDYICGLDDAVRIKGELDSNIKLVVNKILYENYLDEGETYSFNRAYVIIDKDGNIYETSIDIPYSYHALENNFELKEHSYPLSHVACPLGTTTPLSDLDEKETDEYYLKYTKDDLMKLKKLILSN